MNLNLLKVLHKTLITLVTVQFLFWLIVTAIILTSPVDLQYGHHLLQTNSPSSSPPTRIDKLKKWINERPLYDNFSVRSFDSSNEKILKVTNGDENLYLSSLNLKPQPSISAEQADALAKAAIADHESVTNITFITGKNKPNDIISSLLPAWRVDFDNSLKLRVYINPYTREAVTARTKYWYWLAPVISSTLNISKSDSDLINPLHLFILTLALLLLVSYIRLSIEVPPTRYE